MQRLLLFLLTLGLAWFGLRALYHGLASDETRIRWIVEDALEGYEQRRLRPCVVHVAEDWRHEGHAHWTRAHLVEGLRGRFFQERGAPPRRVSLVADSLEIDVTGDQATLALEALFERVRDDEPELLWRGTISADLRHGEDDWELVRTRHTDVEGRLRR